MDMVYGFQFLTGCCPDQTSIVWSRIPNWISSKSWKKVKSDDRPRPIYGLPWSLWV